MVWGLYWGLFNITFALWILAAKKSSQAEAICSFTHGGAVLALAACAKSKDAWLMEGWLRFANVVLTNLTTCDTCFIRKNSRRRYRIFLGDITFGFFSIEVSSNHKIKPNMHDGMARSLAEESMSFFFPFSSLQHQLECTHTHIYIYTYYISWIFSVFILLVDIHPSIHEAIFSGDAHGRIRVWDSASVQHGSRAVLCAGAPDGLGWSTWKVMGNPWENDRKTIGKPIGKWWLNGI